jgi:hypothetical protein
MTSFEDLTLPISYAISAQKKPVGTIRLDENLYQKSLELKEKYSERELIEIRIALEKSYEDFKKKFDEFEEQRTVASSDSQASTQRPITSPKNPSSPKSPELSPQV